MAKFNPLEREFTAWRAVEAQHVVATMALVDNQGEQDLLEQVLDASKPELPKMAEGLHWLLFTPFRYPTLSTGSRFRAPFAPGVFYAAEEIRTSCAELGYWRWRFLMDSPELHQIDFTAHTLFKVRAQGLAIDLRQHPYRQDRGRWTHPVDYSATQQIAADARSNGVDFLYYESVRDPEHGKCVALFNPDTFDPRQPIDSQSWLLRVQRGLINWVQDNPLCRNTHEFYPALWH